MMSQEEYSHPENTPSSIYPLPTALDFETGSLCFLLGLMILAVVPQLPIPRDSGILTLVRGPGTYKLNSLGLAFLFATPGCHSAEKPVRLSSH